MFDGSGVDLIDSYLCLRESCGDVTPAHVPGLIVVASCVGSRKTGLEIQFWSQFDVANDNQFSAMLRGVETFCNHEGDGLAIVIDKIVLQ
jgi:hypothetical protein